VTDAQAELRLERLFSSAVSENVALAQSVGWPDDDADWRVIHEAAFVLGARHGAALVGQGVLAPYEPSSGTIAKMIVSPAMQRQGLGAKLLDALLLEADERQVSSLGLVATPFGEPLYASRGFRVTGEVAVFIGAPRLEPVEDVVSPIADIEQAIAFERRFVSCSRARMLRACSREAKTSAVVTSSDGSLRGFALLSARRPYTLVGPVIAETEPTARALIGAIFAANPGNVRIDVPVEHSALRAWLRELGLPEKGVRPEMTRGEALPWQVPQRFALASQAWG
jgi:GNAT superfamily N-acetyltransferase